jgi:hypothetical protein
LAATALRWFRGRWVGILWNWGPLILWVLAIYWMSDQAVVPHPGRRIGIADDVTDYGGHILTFALLAFLAWRALRMPSLPLRGLYPMSLPWLGGLFAMLYAASDEVHQHFVPGRTASARDWLADVAGILIASMLIAWYQSHKKRDQCVLLPGAEVH